MVAAVYCESFEAGTMLELHVGWSGWIRPPAMGGVACKGEKELDSLGE